MISDVGAFDLKVPIRSIEFCSSKSEGQFLDHPISKRVIGSLEEPARFVGFIVL